MRMLMWEILETLIPIYMSLFICMEQDSVNIHQRVPGCITVSMVRHAYRLE
jgi:hypothetical protein